VRTYANAIRVDTVVDEAVARALPALRALLGKQVELIAIDTTPAPPSGRKITVDELPAARIKPPPGFGRLSEEDIELAIAQGALGR
jgi:hypothetical protein